MDALWLGTVQCLICYYISVQEYTGGLDTYRPICTQQVEVGDIDSTWIYGVDELQRSYRPVVRTLDSDSKNRGSNPRKSSCVL